MSYCSDAAVVMYIDDYKKIKEKIFYTDEIDSFDRHEFERATVSYRYQDDIVILSWKNVNHWGRGSLSMKMFLDFLDTVPHNLIRIGEGVDDQADIEKDMTDFDNFEEYEKFNILGYGISIDIY